MKEDQRKGGAEDERLRNALFVHLREEFVAPAASITGFAEMLTEDVVRLGLECYREDLGRICEAGSALQRRLDEALERKSEPLDLDSYRSQLRHDLRTPINAVKGYTEMLIEDATAEGHAEILPDLRKLIEAADELLIHIDALVDFTGRSGPVRIEADESVLPGAAGVMAALRASDARQREEITGRILVVDDNAANRDLLVRRLTRDGHRVGVASGGAEALDTVRREDFDVILLDILMPGMSGYDVLSTLKADPRTRDIPVIMISGLDEVASIVRCIEAGAADYLPKPFEPALLRARLRSSLQNKFLRDRERALLGEIREAKDRHEALLLDMLPAAVVERLQSGERTIADRIAEATILFADLADFTPFAAHIPAEESVGFLNRVFLLFDRLTGEWGMEKIKTIGDAYMAASGVARPRPDHAEAGARLALAMLENIGPLCEDLQVPVQLRIGLHCGPVVAGVIGERKCAYDIWGATVNLASRMERHGLPGRIHVSEEFARRVGGKFRLEPRGPVEIKGAGLVNTFFLGR